MKPAQIMVISFACIITLGTVLLLLPVSVKEGQSISFIDAMFTATSATCVTGMSICDTYTKFSVFGQSSLILLMQLGGIGTLTLVTFFNLIIGRKLGLLRTSDIMEEHTLDGLSSSRKIFSRIILYSVSVELIGSVIIAFVFVPKHGVYGAFMAFFTAVSSFCNSGFDLLGIENPANPFGNYTDNPLLLFTIMALVIIGGFGYIVFHDIVNFRKKRRLSMHTKVVLLATAVLIAAGAAVYFIIIITNPDYNYMSTDEKIYASVFTSVSTRSSGIAGSHVAVCNDFSEMFSMLLMFIGAAPASTGGGIKVTTMVIIIATLWSVIRGREDTVLMGHRVKKEVVYKTLTVLTLSLIFIMAAFTLIYFNNEKLSAVDLLFETTSAFSTTGFTNGTAAEINGFSKLVLMFTMFVGRIGPVSLFLSLTLGKKEEGNKIIPESTIMIG